MHLLIVEDCVSALESFSERICSEALDNLQFPIEVSVATPDRLASRLPAAEVLIIGPNLAGEALQLASSAKKVCPRISVIVCVPENLQKNFESFAGAPIRASVSCRELGTALRQELMAFHFGAPESAEPPAFACALSEKYQIIRCLGHGSQGSVYACRRKEFDGSIVAVKVLYPELANDEQARARFHGELTTRCGVSHPNVVQAYEYIDDAGFVAFTMEYAGGGSLHDRLSAASPLSIPECVHVMRQAACGLQAIHGARLLHRDLNPRSILFSEAGEVKISDLGLAVHSSGRSEHGAMLGTIDYISPECVEYGQFDARSDIYALGAIGYHMLTGRPPFSGSSVIETLAMRLKGDPPPPSAVRKGCPAELDSVVLRAMRRDPDLRYQRAADLAAALEEHCGS